MTERFFVTKTIEFDAGHRVPLHNSQCRNPHGHRYKVEASWSGPLQSQGSSTGMVIDFGDMKRMLMRIHDEYDHSFIFWQDDTWASIHVKEYSKVEGNYLFKTVMLDVVPTAENLARAFFWDLDLSTKTLFGDTVILTGVRVWETPTSVATYGRD